MRAGWRHRRTIIQMAGVFMLFAAPLGIARLAAAPIGNAAIGQMLTDAEQKAQAGQYADALTTLQRVLQIEPRSAEAWEWTGFCHFALGDRAHAIEAYAAHLKLEPESKEGWAAMNRLFFDFQNQAFPSSLNPDIITVLPVTMDRGTLLTPGKDGRDPVQRSFAYTTSVVFPKPMAYPAELRVPSNTGTDGVNPATITDPRHLGVYNRVSYGYVLDPQTGRLELKLALHYPSATLTGDGTDGTEIANAAMANLLRMWWLSADILGRVPDSNGGPLNIWLTTEGQAGAEQWQNNVFLYELGKQREGAEWLREIGHEWGHLLIPGVDGFDQPEPWANGAMGEALLLRWLTESAEAQSSGGTGELWPGTVDLTSYFAAHNDALLNRFLAEGPNSALLMDRGQKGMDYLVGLVLCAEAAHGAPLVRRMFDALAGDQTPDLVRAYKDTVRAMAPQGIPVNPRLTIPAGEKPSAFTTLSKDPGLVLQPGEKASYWIYLPDGKWTAHVTASGEKQAVLAVVSDTMAEVSTILQPGEHTTGDVQLGEQPDGWKQVTVGLANAEAPVTLERMTFIGTDVGPSPFGPAAKPAAAGGAVAAPDETVEPVGGADAQ